MQKYRLQKYRLAFFRTGNGSRDPYLSVAREFGHFREAYEWFHATAEENGFSQIQQDNSLAGAHRTNPITGETVTLEII